MLIVHSWAISLIKKVFLSKMKKMDFFAVCETWTRDTNFTIPYFRYFNRPANTLSKRRPGRSSRGISLFYRECYVNYVTFVKSSDFYVCCKVAKDKLNLSKDLFICAVYIPPENSPYFDQQLLDDF